MFAFYFLNVKIQNKIQTNKQIPQSQLPVLDLKHYIRFRYELKGMVNAGVINISNLYIYNSNSLL